MSLNHFSLCPYALDDRVWAGITRKLITEHNKQYAARCLSQIAGLWTLLGTSIKSAPNGNGFDNEQKYNSSKMLIVVYKTYLGRRSIHHNQVLVEDSAP